MRRLLFLLAVTAFLLALLIPQTAGASARCSNLYVSGYRVVVTKEYGKASCRTARGVAGDFYRRHRLRKYCRGRRVALRSFCPGYRTTYRVMRYPNWRIGTGAGGGGAKRGPVKRPTDYVWWQVYWR